MRKVRSKEILTTSNGGITSLMLDKVVLTHAARRALVPVRIRGENPHFDRSPALSLSL